MRKKKGQCTKPLYTKATQSETPVHRSRTNHSILQRHERKLQEFRNRKGRLKAIHDRMNALNKESVTVSKEKSFMQLNNEDTSELQLKLSNIQFQLQTLTEQHKVVESGQDEIEYLLESSQIIHDYTLLEESETKLLSLGGQTDELNSIRQTKSKLVDTYLSKFEPNYTSPHTNQSQLCPECNGHFDVEDGFLVCYQCGTCDNGFVHAEELSFKEMRDYEYRPQFTYDKQSHLDDWLRRFQSKENRAIPQEILDKVVGEARKERLSDLTVLTEDRVKRYLKKLGLNEYYDNVIGIINRINGRPPFKLTPEIEQKIKTMFQQIQKPYEKYKPPGRKNFLSYSYVIHKIFQILGLHEFAKYFPLLKSMDKLRQQDDIFKKIVAEMSQTDKTVRWVFYPSM
ncbi:hypothetical protein EB118_07005 [bacterium]|nr:hypothetical protein [bacterium]NDC94393.1 hypothetical protein [bacterium]NDD83934.1 hypothetical protein [bacterium]NDG29829.1 hypothetical protein [bacterium]